MTKEQTLRFGFIGCGEIAVATADAMQAAKNATVTIVMDTKRELAESLGERLQAAATTEITDVLRHPEVDAVYIATPHHLHAPQVIQAAEAGKHVLVEKPLTTSVADGRQMIAACQRAGVRLSVCYVMRYMPATLEARRLVREGAIGKVIGFSIREVFKKRASYWEGGYSGRAQTDWRQFWQTSGGGILNINITHNLDRLRYITGLEAVRVYAEYDTFATPVEVEDSIAVILRMDNGAIGSVQAASCVPGGSWGEGSAARGDHIYGTQGTLVYSHRIALATSEAGSEQVTWREIELTGGDAEARTRYIEEFVAAVFGNKPAPISGEDGLAMVQIVQAAYESGRTHRPVSIEH
ncbi:MAG TPA: Gfo/Idh/MocA family oxidoreductase [Chthonomonadaceae bacterium]|nr:Gfo/Idh/MocA family oxidoreductase [Chthonomonadaceae bacterium]